MYVTGNMWMYANSSLLVVTLVLCFLLLGKIMVSNNAEEAESSGAARRTEVLSLCRRQLSLIIDSMNSLLWLIEAAIELNDSGESAPITLEELLDKLLHVEVDLTIVHEALT
jgi:hypothetical protein